MMSAVQEAACAPTTRVPAARASSPPSPSDPHSTTTFQKTRRWKARPSSTSPASPSTCFHCSFCCSGDNRRGESTNWDWVWDTEDWGESERGRGGEEVWGLVTLPKLNKYKETTTTKNHLDGLPFGFGLEQNGVFINVLVLLFSFSCYIMTPLELVFFCIF